MGVGILGIENLRVRVVSPPVLRVPLGALLVF